MTILRTVTIIAVFMLSSCYSTSDNMQNADRSASDSELQMAQNELNEAFELYRTDKENRLMEYNRTMDEIQQNINNESDSNVRDRLEAELDEYEATHRELKREIESYEVSNQENWENFKNSFTSRIDSLGNSLDDFFSSTSAGTPSRQP